MVTEPSLVELPLDETIVGVQQVEGKLIVYTVKDVTDAG